MVFKPKITVFDCYDFKRELRWLGNLFIPNIFDGQHSILLNRLSENKTQCIHSEFFSGILAKPIYNRIVASTQLGFEQMNIALKNYCEAF